MKITQVPIDKIIVEDRFRKVMGDVTGLADTIKEKGMLQPITIDTNFRLLAGGRRHEACKLLGLKTIPCIKRSTSDNVDALEIELIENIARKDLEWHERLDLEKQILEFKGGTVRKTAEIIGKSKSQVHRNVEMAEAIELIPELKNEKSFSDAYKKLKRITREVGVEHARKAGTYRDAIRFAKDHFQVGDAFKGLQKVKASTVDMCEVDPPYGIDLVGVRSRRKAKEREDKYTEVDSDNYAILVELIAGECYRIMRENTFCIWWFGITHYHTVRETLRAVGFKLSDVPAEWYKGKTGQTNNPEQELANSYETFFVCRKGSPLLVKPGRGNVYDFPPIPAANKTHATEKPLDLMVEILSTVIMPGAIICVPFLGSGVTLRAVYRLHGTGAGWDLSQSNQNYFLEKVQEDIDKKEIDNE